MISKSNRQLLAVISLLLIAVAGFGWNALAEGNKNGSPSAAAVDASMELSGEELWSNNCRRCHNLQPPTMYSPAQWHVIVHHMRVRANITGAEQRAILEFLKSASH